MRFVLIGVLTVTLVVTSTAAAAQSPDPAVGRKVWITLADASVQHGTVVRVDPDTLTLKVSGVTMPIAKDAIRRIEARDDVNDGIVRGAIGVGIAGAAVTGYLGYATCESKYCAPYTLKIGLLGAAMGGAIGAVVGGLLDAGTPGREVIFERTQVSVAPVFTSQSRAVSVVVRW